MVRRARVIRRGRALSFVLLKEDKDFVIAYHIRDDRNTELLGSSTLRETNALITGKKGKIYEVEFITKLPVLEGNYNVTLVASVPIIRNRTALFLGYVENAAVFSVEENFEGKLWDKVYIENQVTIRTVD